MVKYFGIRACAFMLRRVLGFCAIDMAEDALLPPKCVRGMRVLDRDAFRKVVSVPAIRVEPKHCLAVRQRFDGRLLAFKGIKTIIDDPETEVG